MKYEYTLNKHIIIGNGIAQFSKGYNSIKGKPFSSNEILEAIKIHLKD